MRVPGVRFVQGRNRYGTSTKYGIAVHATANTAPAVNEASYATHRTDGTSSHLYADAITVIQSLDTADVAGHAGSYEGNQYGIAVEITGLNSWSRAKWLASVAWDKLGAALAAVSMAHGIPASRATVAQMKANPRVRGAYDHNQMRLAWGGTDHTDPGPNFPWDKLLAVWQQHLNGEDDDMPTVEQIATEVWFRDVDPSAKRENAWVALHGVRLDAAATVNELRALRGQVGGLVTTVNTLADVLNSGGSSIDTAAVLARIDQRSGEDAKRDAEQRAEIDQLRAKLAAAAQAEAAALGTQG